MKKISILFVGFGGYGNVYANDVLNNPACPEMDIVGVVDPFPENGNHYQAFLDRGIPFFPTMDAFFAQGKADLCVISTPIQFHTANILSALSHGCHVLCEKPLCGDPADVDKLIAARDVAGKNVWIGYQWSHNTAIGALKADIASGKFGAPVELKTLILWPRDDNYWGRSTKWAGKIHAADGSLIYDSIANNACGHYLHNMFYVLGDCPNGALAPKNVEAQLLRANPIENFDAAAIVCTMPNDAKCFFLAAHTIDKNVDPLFCYRFEKGTVYFAGCENPAHYGVDEAEKYEFRNIKAVMNDGTIVNYGNPFDDECRKMHLAIRAAGGENVPELCGIETASVHTQTIGRIQETCPIHNVKQNLLRRRDNLTYVEGLGSRMMSCYNNPEKYDLSDFWD